MNLLVTGGAGFIGSNFIRSVLSNPLLAVERIVNLDLLTYAGNLDNLKELNHESRYSFLHGDIRDENIVRKALQTYKIDAVVHFAAESHVDRSIASPEPFFQTNVIGTLRLINYVKDYWSSLAVDKRASFRFLHVSTDEVYGSLGELEQPWDENCPYEPNSPYAASKAASDHLVRAFHHTYGLPVITTNCSNNYGPYQYPEKLIPLMINNAIDGLSLPIYGDGQQIRDWLFVDDHVNAICLALVKGIVGKTYNVGGLNEKTNLEIVYRICSILDSLNPRSDGQSYKEQIKYVTDRPGHDRRYAINSSRIRNELGWTPDECFDTGIFKTVKWYLEHRDWSRKLQTNKNF
jgi:dTDP-glucose 4,6-dehydratase